MSYYNYLEKINSFHGKNFKEIDIEVESTYERLRNKLKQTEKESYAFSYAKSIIDALRGAAPVSTLTYEQLHGYIRWKDLFESLKVNYNGEVTPFLDSPYGGRYRNILERYDLLKDHT